MICSKLRDIGGARTRSYPAPRGWATIENVGEPFLDTKGRRRGVGICNVKKVVESVDVGVVGIDTEVGPGTRVEPRVQRKESRGTLPVRKSHAEVGAWNVE